MKIKILTSAVEDLHSGRLFYENQGEGIGEYFFDSLFSDIDSLVLYAGIHQKVFGYHRLLSKRFPMPSTTHLMWIWCSSGESWTCDETQAGFAWHSIPVEQPADSYGGQMRGKSPEGLKSREETVPDLVKGAIGIS